MERKKLTLKGFLLALQDLADWLSEISRQQALWFAKRLSANDTLANQAHQAGPYIPKSVLFRAFPSINREDLHNPDYRLQLLVDSHREETRARAIWYNNKFHGGTRNEARLTNFGGGKSAVLDAESTGALAIFAFIGDVLKDPDLCRVWVCSSSEEEDLVEERIGPVEPGRFACWSTPQAEYSLSGVKSTRPNCRLSASDLPDSWLLSFPSGLDIINKVVDLLPMRDKSPDERLIVRRECEYELFLSVEEAVELPAIQRPFASIDEFVAKANTILQRRKARSGRSLELHTKTIFLESGLKQNIDFAHGAESEPGRRPDFLFPSQSSYRDMTYPTERLRMLATKTTCKDRWRQVLNEANRIREKHLLTLQEGVSPSQFNEMMESGVRLVVPSSLVKCYHKSIRKSLIDFSSFINQVNNIHK